MPNLADALTPQPLYGQVRQALVERIRMGEWMVGDSLPNETFLAQRFGVSVGTVRKAIEGLENNGLVTRIQGRGTYVAGVGSHVLREKFFRLRAPDGQPVDVGYELLKISRASASDSGCGTQLWGDADIIEVSQRLHVKDLTIGLEVSYLRSEMLPSFEKQMTFGQDIYPILADYGFIVTKAKEIVSFVTADAAVTSLFDLSSGTMVMRSTRQAFGLDLGLLEYRISYYRLDRIAYSADLD